MPVAFTGKFPLQKRASGKSIVRQFVEDWGIRMLSGLGATARSLVGSRSQQSFGILMYHRIAHSQSGIPFPTINVEPARFRLQISRLLELGYEFWPLRKVIEHQTSGLEIPDNVVVVTFDDGFECVYTEAWPILRELMVPATVFVSTAYVGSDSPFPFDRWGLLHHRDVERASYAPMSWQQCREMIADGLVEIGCHTHTHQDFRNAPDLLEEDLSLSIAQLRDQLSIDRPTFAFPYGTPRLGFASSEMVKAAREMGLSCALNAGGNVVKPRHQDPFNWGRFNVFPWDSGDTIAGRLDGWYSWAPKVWHAVQSVPQVLLGKPKSDKTRPVLAPAASEATDQEEKPVTKSSIPPLPKQEFESDLISIVMPTYNRCEWLDAAIRSLAKLETNGKFRVELLVADNDSADRTEEVVRRCQAELDLPITYLLEKKPGDAPPRNRGIRNARGRWFAFFDDDQFANPNWLIELHKATQVAGATVVGGSVHLHLPEEDLRRLGPICRKALRETILYPNLQPYAGKDLPGTGNALVERHVFEAVGLFDEAMNQGGSDFDFFARARRAGYELWYAPEAVIRHRVSPQRMTQEYFRWDALSSGVEQAHSLYTKSKSALWTATLGVARLGQAMLINVPMLMLGWVRRDAGEVLGRRTRIWRVEGYCRKVLNLFSPSMFRQQRFFHSLEFRNGRTVGSDG